MGRAPVGIDILTQIPGVDFDAAWNRRAEEIIDPASGLTASFISRDDLIAAKLASGRPQDRGDVDAIRKALESRRAKPAKIARAGPKTDLIGNAAKAVLRLINHAV